jgi:hypothetical protein
MLYVSRQNEASATRFFFLGRYSNVTPYCSKGESKRKTWSEAFKRLKVLFLWSVETMMEYSKI